jgi:predicted amidohydrolase YtcJ
VLIRDAELDFGARRADVRLAGGVVAEIAPRLQRHAGEEGLDAQGRALMPSLCDHHIHLQATAAAAASVDCRPAACADEAALVQALRAAEAGLPAGKWLRGVGFDEASLAGSGQAADRSWLDGVLPDRPVRLQHRSGRMWLLNSAALRALGVDPEHAEAPLETENARATGRLYDADAWLRARRGSQRPDLSGLSRSLWSMGVTALTDCSHANDADDWQAFAAAQAEGALLQDLRVMGSAALDAVPAEANTDASRPRLTRGERKFHLHDNALPDIDALSAAMRAAHAAGRGVAVHCVSRVDLPFALAALRAAGPRPGDRIEHASVAPPEAVAELAALGVIVVTQPALVAERGDRYLTEVDAEDQSYLYRLAGLRAAGIGLALSSDAPYGNVDPWAAMAAAVSRRTRAGVILGSGEALTPEAAYAGFAGPPDDPARAWRPLATGAPADLILLDRSWAAARAALASVRPEGVWRRGVAPIT